MPANAMNPTHQPATQQATQQAAKPFRIQMKLTKGNKYDIIQLTCTGWTEGDGTGHDGYDFTVYFRDGFYLGADENGIEPIFDVESPTAFQTPDDHKPKSMAQKHHINIDDETMTVLRASDVSATSVKLPPGLARPLYMKVNKVLETAGGKWSRKEQAHTFTVDPRETLGLAVEKGAILDTKKATQAFYTPHEVARVVLMHLGDLEGKTVLEPSAGRGALAAQCLLSGATVLCIESDPISARHLQGEGFNTLCLDFLKVDPHAEYDRVAMNPPFAGGQDIDHVTHAFKFLKPGGRLVSIMSPGWETARNKKAKAFRDLVAAYGYVAERLEPGAFKECGTGIATVIVILDNP